jgi:hypothetical protein
MLTVYRQLELAAAQNVAGAWSAYSAISHCYSRKTYATSSILGFCPLFDSQHALTHHHDLKELKH